MAAGWDGAPKWSAPGFPTNGQWNVRLENLKTAPQFFDCESRFNKSVAANVSSCHWLTTDFQFTPTNVGGYKFFRLA